MGWLYLYVSEASQLYHDSNKLAINQPTYQPINQKSQPINQKSQPTENELRCYVYIITIIRPALSFQRAVQQKSQQNTVNNIRKMKPKYTLKSDFRRHLSTVSIVIRHQSITTRAAENVMNNNDPSTMTSAPSADGFACDAHLQATFAVCHSRKCNTGLHKNSPC